MQGFHEKSGINTNGKNSPNDGTGMRVNPSFSWGDGLKPGRASDIMRRRGFSKSFQSKVTEQTWGVILMYRRTITENHNQELEQ
jgi:hypothetical protein